MDQTHVLESNVAQLAKRKLVSRRLYPTLGVECHFLSRSIPSTSNSPYLLIEYSIERETSNIRVFSSSIIAGLNYFLDLFAPRPVHYQMI